MWRSENTTADICLNIMDREELMKYLPHREPMLLVDEVEIDDAGVAHAR